MFKKVFCPNCGLESQITFNLEQEYFYCWSCGIEYDITERMETK